jgi:hypothetical protein
MPPTRSKNSGVSWGVRGATDQAESIAAAGVQ